MSVFHRVDDLDELPAAQFFPRMVRLPVYDGAVRFALLDEASEPQRPQAAPKAEPESVNAYSRDEFAALNQSRMFGPLPGATSVGVFDVG